MTPRVLFVDDEPMVLNGVRRMLRGKRGEWDVLFANSGAEALAVIEDQAVDVVISDMRMPKMDGSQLLEKLSKSHPETVRIILSGFVDQDAVMSSIGAAHQYLAKPCDSAVLAETIRRSIELRQLLHCERLKSVVSGITHLPTPPAIYTRLIAELASPNANAHTVGEIIAQDVAMATETLKLTNSAFFATNAKVTSPAHAVTLLGFDTIRVLITVIGIYRQFSGSAGLAHEIARMNEHALRASALAGNIARQLGLAKPLVDLAVCGGLLANVGRLVMAAELPSAFAQAIESARDDGVDLAQAEHAAMAANHGELGAYMLGLWGFPDPVVEAIAYHMVPSLCCIREPGLLCVLHAAEALVGEYETSNPQTFGEVTPVSLDHAYLSEVGVSAQVESWRNLLETAAAAE